MKKGTAKFSLLLALFALLASILACQQSGDIITEAEATARAMPTSTPTSIVAEGSLESGTVAYLTGKSYLINLVDAPGSFHMIAGQERGVEVIVIQSTLHKDKIWYLVDAPTGEGWLPEENLTTEKPE